MTSLFTFLLICIELTYRRKHVIFIECSSGLQEWFIVLKLLKSWQRCWILNFFGDEFHVKNLLFWSWNFGEWLKLVLRFYCANKKVRFSKWPNSPTAHSRKIFFFFFLRFSFCLMYEITKCLHFANKFKVSKQPMRSGRSSLLRSFLNNFAVVKVNEAVGKRPQRYVIRNE